MMIDALKSIAALDPERDTNEGTLDEWGEAEAFHIAQNYARAALTDVADPMVRLLSAVDKVMEAYADRWVRVDCTRDEERTLRELNDLLNELDPHRRGE